MSDSSSVDRWHPSNVRLETLTGTPYVMYEDYTALFADRGRVLAAARELADAVAHIEAEWVDKPGWLHEPVSVVGVECRNAFAALASFREVDHG